MSSILLFGGALICLAVMLLFLVALLTVGRSEDD